MTGDALSAAVELDARAVGSRCGGSRAGAWLVLGVSGAFGFYLGFRVYPNWQVAVETAQVVAGIVKYPAGNPFYIYHTKLWTILHQICAVALLAGVSEITLSRVLSGVIGMVSIQALSLCTYAFCRRPWLSIGSGLFVLATRSASNGANYPIRLMATEHTYGALGLSTFALAGAALGAGLPGLGGFLVGLMPSIHPSLGLWLWIIVLLAVLWDVAYARAEFARAFWWFAAGAAITTISLVVQLTVTYDVPKIDPAEAAKYFYAFVNFWDVHRSSVNINGLAVVVNRIVLGVGILWLVMFRPQLPRQSAFLLRMMVIGAAVGIAMAYASWIPPDRIPLSVLTVMPTRVLNFNGMIVVAALIGLIARYEEKWSAALLLVLLLGGLLLSNRSMLWEWNVAAPWAGLQRGFDPSIVIEAAAALLVCIAGVEWFRGAGTTSGGSGWTRPALSSTAPLATAALLLVAFSGFLTLRLQPDIKFRDRTNDPFFAAVAAERDGFVLTAGSYQLVQLYTRRPVLLCGALDTLPYAPESGPAMENILRDVYGADLLNPPEIAHGRGVLPREFHRPLWESYPLEKWQEIRRTYDVHVVLVPGDWQLHLPIASDSGGFRLYRIPA